MRLYESVFQYQVYSLPNSHGYLAYKDLHLSDGAKYDGLVCVV